METKEIGNLSLEFCDSGECSYLAIPSAIPRAAPNSSVGLISEPSFRASMRRMRTEFHGSLNCEPVAKLHLTENEIPIEQVVILGSGAAGSSAAIFAAQADRHPLVIQDTDCNAQMALIHNIDNYPGVTETIDGDELLHSFRDQAKKFGARFEEEDHVVKVDLLNRPFKIELASGRTIFSQSVIIATGTVKKWLEVPNESAFRGKGVVGASFCKETDFTNKTVVVVGSGHAALQEAQFLSSVAKEVILVNRGKEFHASRFHQELVFNNPKIRVLYETEVENILGIADEKVTGIALKEKNSQTTSEIPTDIVLVAIGNKPNSDLFIGQLDLASNGAIKVNGKNSGTNIPGVFVAGDVSDVAYGRVVIAAGAGGMAALDAANYLDQL